MKKVLALMIALLMLLLCACGHKSASAQGEQGKADAQQTQIEETTTEGYYVEEEPLADGGRSTTYRVGSSDGVIAKITREFVDGSYTEERYDSEGKLEYSIHNRPDNYV